ncbi:hypothetical protein BCD67_15695 [Oscillatoriales cyanobacterium USR001]|nr:hypothetical protein BCD67_15695 [Oscillatoriales cyanobacterium USR001]
MSFSNSPSCIQDPNQPKCVIANLLKKLAEKLNHLSGKIAEANQISEEPKSHNKPSPASENGNIENERFSEFDTVIKENSSNLSEIIVDLIMNNQVGNNSEKIHSIRLETAKLLQELKALDKAEIEPEVKKQISKRMKANMSEILVLILTH